MPTAKIKINLTGNPFVDTGLAVIASLADLEDINELDLSHIRKVFGDGTQLAEKNAHLKTFTQVFGTNNPLFQFSYGFKKGVGPSDINKAIYINTLNGFLNNIGKDTSGQKCWACGESTQFLFSETCKKAIEAEGKNAPQVKWVGREWFPLAGSLGSDAQALPAASQAPLLCPKCLFAIHYLPQGLMLLDGRLAVFQSTSTEFWYELIRDIVNEVKSRVSSGNNETLGKNEGSREIMRRVFPLFELLQASRYQGIPEYTSLYIWRFSNAGPNAECMIEEIPNPSLIFLWDATKMGLRPELESLINSENKNPQNALYHCISEGREYPNIYPDGKKPGASIKLYTLYQTEILGHSIDSLRIAYNLAKTVVNSLPEKELKRIKRPEAFSDEKNRAQVRHSIVQMADLGELTLDDYLDIFPLNKGKGISVRWDGWNLIHYYLHHSSEEFPDLNDVVPKGGQVVSLLPYYAATIYNHYLKERGKDRFQKEVISRINRGIDSIWLRNQFAYLAESEIGFTYENWENLCKRDDGREFTTELIFQMRLLWIQWLREEKGFVNTPTPQPCGNEYTGIPAKIDAMSEIIFRDYVEQRGIERFHRDILMRFRKKDIDISWLKNKFAAQKSPTIKPLTDQKWDEFTVDEQGDNIIRERIFQFHLQYANLYRLKMCNEVLY